jgi:hypothetical protein
MTGLDPTSERRPSTAGATERKGRLEELVAELHAREDAHYAEWLMERQWSDGLHRHEAEWLKEWQGKHEAPDRNNYQTGRQGAEDLGVPMVGLAVDGSRYIDQLGNGNVNIAGGWYASVESVESENGWPRGYVAKLSGLDAFLEGMALDPIPEASERLGPFYDERHPTFDYARAYEELAKRLLATLVIVSRAALEANPEAQKRMEQQRAAHEQRLGESTFEEVRRRLEDLRSGE